MVLQVNIHPKRVFSSLSCYRYPDATSEDLTNGDNVCIICREEMTVMCKKLPCNHIFHVSCLRSWFQRQQTCPTCRLDVLRAPRSAPSADANRPGDSIQANASGQHQQPRPIPPGGKDFTMICSSGTTLSALARD